MARISTETIEELKSRLDLGEVVQRFVELKQAGDRLMGVCPFHQETKPSLSVNPGQGFYYCFGCQASGDVIDFYCRINGLEFVEGVHELARECGMQLEPGSREESGQARARRMCLEMHSLAQSYFRSLLREADGARAYLRERGLRESVIEHFGLGWSPDAWDGLKRFLAERGYSPEQGVEAGLLSRSARGRIFDRFRSRVTFPIYDLTGRVVAFGGRVVGEGEPKYLNSSETPIFKKGEVLYGLYQARKHVTQTKEALLTEGYADVLSLVQHGFVNACGVLGTALTRTQVQRLAGLCRRVVLLFDGDRAGREAALRSTEMLLRAGLEVRAALLPEGSDADDVLRGSGPDALRSHMEQAREGLVFAVKMISSEKSPKEVSEWAVHFLRGFRDLSLQAYYLPKVAHGLGLSESGLRRALDEQSPGGARSAGARRASTAPAQRDREILGFAVAHPEYLHRLRDEGVEIVLKTERGRSFWKKLLEYGHEAVSHQLDEGEKRFFFASKLHSRCSDPEEVFADFCGRIRQAFKKVERSKLHEALSRLNTGELTEEDKILLKKYSDFLREEQ
jgi:DNA primase